MRLELNSGFNFKSTWAAYESIRVRNLRRAFERNQQGILVFVGILTQLRSRAKSVLSRLTHFFYRKTIGKRGGGGEYRHIKQM